MNFTFLLMLGSLFLIFIFFFSKKIIVLLSLEGAMLSAISHMQVNCFTSFSSIFVLILFSVFMVLDSVLGISLMISSSRSSGSVGKMLN